MSVEAPSATAGIELRLDPPAEAIVFMGTERSLERIAVTELVLHDGEALVEIELATVCGSDLHTAAGHRRVAVPQVLGHEQVGRIVALGPGMPPRALDGVPLAVGDRVIWSTQVACGSCRLCLRGIPNKCEHLVKYGHEQMRRGWELGGGIATHVHLLARTAIIRVREDLPAEVLAPASCATATVAAVLAAAEGVRPLDGEIIVVSGCGMLGLTAIAMASELGAQVVAVDPVAARRTLAWDFGADAIAEPTLSSVREAIAVAGRTGRAQTAGAAGFGVGLELSGSNDSIALLIDAADIGATIVLAGSVFTAHPISISAEAVVRRLLTIRGVHNYRPEDLVRAVDFLQRANHQAFAALVGEVVPFSEAERALAAPATIGTRVGVRPAARGERSVLRVNDRSERPIVEVGDLRAEGRR